VNLLVFSGDGRLLVSVNGGEVFFNRSAQVWTMPGGQLVRTIPCEERIVEATFNNDGRFLAIMSMPEINMRNLIGGVQDNRQSVQVWDVASGQLLVTPVHEDDVKAIAFSHDGKILATANRSKDETEVAMLWDVASGRRLSILPHQGTVTAVTFHPNDHMLATVSGNRTTAFWEIAPDPFLTKMSHKNVTEAMFSPDSSLLVTTGDGESVGTLLLNASTSVGDFDWSPSDDATYYVICNGSCI
jgi:WD40 repeat protein